MPSNKEIISKAIEKTIQSNEAIDLLLISDTLDNINGEVVGSEPEDYGMHYNLLYIGMSGQKFVDQMNSNFNATDSQFLSINNELKVRIISNTIKEFKEDNGVIYYRVDEEYIPLQSSWGKIVGNITDQEDLQTALSDKVSSKDFDTLSSSVSKNTDAVLLLRGDVDNLTTSVDSLINDIHNGTNGILIRLDNIEDLLTKKITSTTVKAIRTVNDTALEFTTNGTEWHPVSSAGLVEWGDIIGDISNQADLALLFNNINTTINNNQEVVNNHLSNTANPHGVTAEQIGLGRVNNTSDEDKPISAATRIALAKLEAKIPEEQALKVIGYDAYKALAEKDNNTLYFITDL